MKNKSFSQNRIFLPIMFIAFSIILELINFLCLSIPNGESIAIFPKYFLFDLAVIVVIAGLIYAVKNKIAMQVIFYLFLVTQAAVSIVNSTMYNVFGDILSFDLFKLGAEAASAFKWEFVNWPSVLINIAALGIFIALTSVLLVKNKRTVTVKAFSSWALSFAVMILGVSFGTMLFQVEKAMLRSEQSAYADEYKIADSDLYLWENFQFKLEAFKKFGYYGFYSKSLMDLIFGTEFLTDFEKENLTEKINSSVVEENTNASFHDDNLILILCESLEWFAIDPYNTPTLYKMTMEGNNTQVMQSFYARNKTNISEGITLLDFMPQSVDMVNDADSSKGEYYKYTLPKMFKALSGGNRVANYFHTNYKTFYRRDRLYSSELIGFDNIYGYEDFTDSEEMKWFGDWNKDADFIEYFKDIIIPNDNSKFFSCIASLSTHGPYDYENPKFKDYYQIYDSNLEMFEDWLGETTNYIVPTDKVMSDYLRRYKAGAIDLDRSVELIMKDLERKGKLDDTTIVLYGDHNAYYHDMTFNLHNIQKSDFSNTEVHRIPLLIFNKDFVGEKITSFCNTYDILPTLTKMYGFRHNKAFYQGYDIFSEEIANSFFASHLSGMFNQDFYSLNIVDLFPQKEGGDKEGFKRAANRFYEKQKMINTVFKNKINYELI